MLITLALVRLFCVRFLALLCCLLISLVEKLESVYDGVEHGLIFAASALGASTNDNPSLPKYLSFYYRGCYHHYLYRLYILSAAIIALAASGSLTGVIKSSIPDVSSRVLPAPSIT